MVLQGGDGFLWDDDNVTHAQHHGFTAEQVEEALNDPLGTHFFATDTDEEEQFGWLGMVDSGAVLVIIYAFRKSLVRPFSARRATHRERRMYTERRR